MNIQDILEDLKYNTGVLPRQALREAVAKRELITPALLEIIEKACTLPEVLYQESYMAHIYAVYLLAQFREVRAYPLIVRFFSIPDEIVKECMGTVVTEDLHRILASVAHGDASLIKTLAENEAADEFVRAAALEALVTQVVCGEATREDVLAYYASLFRARLERKSSQVWDALVSCSTDLYPEEVVDDIKRAIADDLLQEATEGEWVTERLAQGKETVLRQLQADSRHELIGDVAEEIGGWHCFNEPTACRVTSVKVKVGRNDPCPCGSGKKYKKCCGRR